MENNLRLPDNNNILYYNDCDIVLQAKDYAIKKHLETNHKYDGNKPYDFHLKMVNEYAVKYGYLIQDKNLLINILASSWTHDLIEDCRETYNDVKNILNSEIADITFALTNDKGKNRKERAGKNYYSGIRMTDGATYLKVCDRMANIKYSKLSGSSMFEKYKMENKMFDKELRNNSLNIMFDDLISMFL